MQFPAVGLDQDRINGVQAFLQAQQGIYSNLDIAATLDYFTRQYVFPLAERVVIENAVIVDGGAGHGWFSFAYLLAGGKQAIIADIAQSRLNLAREIAKILNLSQQIQFIQSGIQDIPLQPDSADIFVSLETLEHIGQENIKPALRHIKNIASQAILIATPNKLFPVVPHDTRLPFVHWLPPRQRKIITQKTKRANLDQGNQFVSPFDLKIIMDKYRPDTVCMTFRNVNEFKNSFPLYKPYGADNKKRLRLKAPLLLTQYYSFICPVFQKHAYWLMPSISCIFVRR